MTLADRFWAKVERGEGCWLWTASLTPKGYGQFYVRATGRRTRLVGAHRVAWLLTYGTIPSGAFVLHRCDVRACVRPGHLFLDTHADNMADMVAKGRAHGVRGQANANAVLTEHQVHELRRRHADGESQRSLARIYGLNHSTVHHIVHRRTWSHV